MHIVLAFGALGGVALAATETIAFTDELALLLPVGAVIVGITLPQAARSQSLHQWLIECQPVAAGLQHGFR